MMRPIPTWFVLGWVLVVGVVALGGGALTYGFVRDRAAELAGVIVLPKPPQVGHSSSDEAPAAAEPTITPAVDSGMAETPESTPAGEISGSVAEDVTPATQPAEMVADTSDDPTAYVPQLLHDPHRVNVLLLGIDQREGEQGPFPTDTIILLSLDPVGKTGAIFSIPRDLWVVMPGLEVSDRINAANIRGEAIDYPGGGGPAFAAAAVERVLGIDEIDFYVMINFEVFYTVVDAVGPIEVCPPEEIYDDKYPDGSYGYITVHFPAGCQDLDSEKLLQYARTRHSDSDIGRSSRQQEVILSIRRKVLSAGGIVSLVPEAASIWQSMQTNIRTNMSFEDMVNLAFTAEKVPQENIRQGQITFGEVEIGQGADGSQVLTPISSDIQLLLADLFRPPGTPSTRTPPASE